MPCPSTFTISEFSSIFSEKEPQKFLKNCCGNNRIIPPTNFSKFLPEDRKRPKPGQETQRRSGTERITGKAAFSVRFLICANCRNESEGNRKEKRGGKIVDTAAWGEFSDPCTVPQSCQKQPAQVSPNASHTQLSSHSHHPRTQPHPPPALAHPYVPISRSLFAHASNNHSTHPTLRRTPACFPALDTPLHPSYSPTENVRSTINTPFPETFRNINHFRAYSTVLCA